MTDGKDHPEPVPRVPTAWEHGDMSTVTFLSLRDYSNRRADIAALGLRNGNGTEFAGKGDGCKRDKRGMIAVNVKNLKLLTLLDAPNKHRVWQKDLINVFNK